VFRALSIETVGKQHNQAIVYIPFSFTRYDKLVYHNLSAISEISKLSFPKSEGVRQCLCITILKAQNSVFRQMRVAGNKLASFLLRILHGLADWAIVTVFILEEHVSVSV
jgi:hypothetical protein